MISTTAKDLSLLITIGPDSSTTEFPSPLSVQCPCKVDDSCPVKLAFTLAVCDLDAKPLSKIPTYLQLDQDILKSVMRYISTTATVSDSAMVGPSCSPLLLS